MLFVLLSPQQDGSLPDVYCVAQVCLEGNISRETVQRELQKGARSAGDLIPWIVARQFLDSDFSQLSGARIVRIATHPDVQGMGYGRRTLQLLRQYFEGKIEFTGEEEADGMDEDDDDDDKIDKTDDGSLHEVAKPRKHLPSLLVSLSDRRPERLHVSPFPSLNV